MNKVSDIRVVATSLIVSVSDVALNVVVAIVTGSTVMLSQALQGMSDLVTGGILYFGLHQSKRKRSKQYQFGYGRELFFWVLIAGIVMFVGAGGMSVLFGYQQFIAPTQIDSVWLALGMLSFGLITNGYAFSLSVKRLKAHDTSGRWLRQLLHSSIVETKATFLIDLLGTSSALLGLFALGAYILTGNPMFDGLGSIIIGVTMMCVALVLINDVRSLIVGKSVDVQVARRITESAESVIGVRSVLDLRTMYLGSDKLLVIVEVHIHDNLNTDRIEKVVDNVKDVVKSHVPQVHHIQVEIETPDQDLGSRPA